MSIIYEELAEESRRRILFCLLEAPKRVSDLVQETGLKQPNVSNHLARLRTKGVLNHEKVGREVYYSITDPDIMITIHKAFTDQVSEPIEIDFQRCVKEYARAAVNGDKATCQRIIDNYVRANVSIVDIYCELLAPSMELVGVWYHVHAIDEAQEHLASAITERMMTIVNQLKPSLRSLDNIAVLGCAANNWHVIGLRMISDYLRYLGWQVFFIGANVPPEAFKAAVIRHQPDLVLVSGTAQGTENDLEEVIQLLAEVKNDQKFTLVGGGRLVNESAARYLDAGMDHWAPNLRAFAETLLPKIEKASSR